MEKVEDNANKITPDVIEALFDSMANTDTTIVEVINRSDIRKLPRSKTFGAHFINNLLQEVEKIVNDVHCDYTSYVTPIHYMLSLDSTLQGLDEEERLRKLKLFENRGFNYNQIFRVQNDVSDTNDIGYTYAINFDGPIVALICMKQNYRQIIDYLFGPTFVQYWRVEHFKYLLKVALKMKNTFFMQQILDSHCCKHTFLSLYDQNKNCDFKANFIEEAFDITVNQPYVLARLN